METLLFVLVLLLNIGIAWWNARVAGLAWVESKALGGWLRLVVWCAALQSVVGFSVAYLVGMTWFAAALGWLDAQTIGWIASLWYVALIVPALGSGLIITIHSWIVAARERSLLTMGAAGWSVFAQAHNTHSAVQSLGPALSNVGDVFGAITKGGGSGDDTKARMALLAILLVICALLAGVLTTAVLIQRHAANPPMPQAGGHGARVPCVRRSWDAAR